MSLVQKHRIAVAGAMVLAVLVPHFLLTSQAHQLSGSPPIVVTKLEAAPAGDLDLAYSQPIFTPSRAVASGDAGEGETEPVSAPVPTLVGLVVRGKAKGVALVRASNGQTITLGSGELVDGWRLTGLTRDAATFEKAGERQVVSLDFSNKSSEPSPPSAAAEGS